MIFDSRLSPNSAPSGFLLNGRKVRLTNRNYRNKMRTCDTNSRKRSDLTAVNQSLADSPVMRIIGGKRRQVSDTGLTIAYLCVGPARMRTSNRDDYLCLNRHFLLRERTPSLLGLARMRSENQMDRAVAFLRPSPGTRSVARSGRLKTARMPLSGYWRSTRTPPIPSRH